VLHFGSSSSSWAVPAIERRGCSGAVLSICVRGGHLVLRRPLAGRGASEIAMKNSTTLRRRRRLPAPLVDAFWTGGDTPPPLPLPLQYRTERCPLRRK